jgi:hypothetical protein
MMLCDEIDVGKLQPHTVIFPVNSKMSNDFFLFCHNSIFQRAGEFQVLVQLQNNITIINS